MRLALDILSLGFAWFGAILVAIAAIGIVRMPDLFSRLQASSKAPALAIALLAIAVGLQFRDPEIMFRLAMLVVLLFITSPIAAHLIARAGFITGIEPEPETRIETGGEDAD